MVLYHLGRAALVPVVHALYRPTVTGRDNVPSGGGVLLASNHLSFVDSFAIPLVAPRKVRFLAKDEYFTGTGVRGALRRALFDGVGALPVDRDSPRAARESLDLALEVLCAGDAFGIYPEGTRSRDGRLYRGRTGVAWLALTAQVPVVPVGLVGTDKVMPVGTRLPRPTRIQVHFGAPIDPQRYAGMPSGKARRALTDDVMAAIAALTGQPVAPAYNPLPSTPD